MLPLSVLLSSVFFADFIKGPVPLNDEHKGCAKRIQWTTKGSELAPSRFHLLQKSTKLSKLQKQNGKERIRVIYSRDIK